jgi:hypothetical protein
MNGSEWFFVLAWLIVAIAWFYAYKRTKTKGFGIMGLATLIVGCGQLYMNILIIFTEAVPQMIHSSKGIVAYIIQIGSGMLALYGIASLIKYFEKVKEISGTNSIIK